MTIAETRKKKFAEFLSQSKDAFEVAEILHQVETVPILPVTRNGQLLYKNLFDVSNFRTLDWMCDKMSDKDRKLRRALWFYRMFVSLATIDIKMGVLAYER